MTEMRVAAWGLTAVSAVAWGLTAAATWANVDPRALIIEAAAAVSLTGLAGKCHIAYCVRDRDKDALVDAMAALSLRCAEPDDRKHLRVV